MKKSLIFLDTETTGNQSSDRLLQIAYKEPGQAYDSMFDKLYKPPVAISIESMAVHHITNEHVADKPAFIDSEDFQPLKELLESEETVMVAHNAKFDIDMLQKEGIQPSQRIDTLRLVRHYDPDMKIKRHNMQYLRYLLELDKDIDEPIKAHDAKGDVIILELLFDRLYKKTQEAHPDMNEQQIIDEMIAISSRPTLISKFTFGKHNGKRVADVAAEDRGYLEWLYTQKQQSEQDEEDWLYTLEHFLK